MALRRLCFTPVYALLAVLAAACLVAVPAGTAMAATANGGAHSGQRTVAPPRLAHRSLASILRSDGTLRSSGASGSFDPAGTG